METLVNSIYHSPLAILWQGKAVRHTNLQGLVNVFIQTIVELYLKIRYRK
jgi:hypothetical protein